VTSIEADLVAAKNRASATRPANSPYRSHVGTIPSDTNTAMLPLAIRQPKACGVGTGRMATDTPASQAVPPATPYRDQHGSDKGNGNAKDGDQSARHGAEQMAQKRLDPIPDHLIPLRVPPGGGLAAQGVVVLAVPVDRAAEAVFE